MYNKQLKTYLIRLMIKYLNQYIKKGFYMNKVFIESKQNLKNNESITIEQFNFILKFIEREKPFRFYNKNQIMEYFLPIINKNIDKEDISSLEEFMVW